MLHASVHLTLPAWIHDEVDVTCNYPDATHQIALAIDLSRRNVMHGSGGPFGAAVFNSTGRLIGIGVNCVIAAQCSAAHAELMALASSQQSTQRYRLNATGDRITLATSSQPCAMCYGALIWAGIDELLIAARSEDVEDLTNFDEGPLPTDWSGELEKRDIRVQRDLLRDQACAVLREYGKSGIVY